MTMLAGVEVCVVDPPRKGLEATLLAALCRPRGNPHPRMRVDDAAREPHDPAIPDTEPPGKHVDAARDGMGGAMGPEAFESVQLYRPEGGGRVGVKGRGGEDHDGMAPQSDSLAAGGFEGRQGGLRTLIYLSCGFAAFRRDYSALMQSGQWELQSASAFLFFPGTDSLEVLAVFRRPGQ